jgi:hypothetical protein
MEISDACKTLAPVGTEGRVAGREMMAIVRQDTDLSSDRSVQEIQPKYSHHSSYGPKPSNVQIMIAKHRKENSPQLPWHIALLLPAVSISRTQTLGRPVIRQRRQFWFLCYLCGSCGSKQQCIRVVLQSIGYSEWRVRHLLGWSAQPSSTLMASVILNGASKASSTA